MRFLLIAIACMWMLSGAGLSARRSVPASDATCQGSACLQIYNVRHGTRCGTRDSVEADYANESNALYLRGYVIFNTPNGKQYVPTDLMRPGEKRESPGNAYVCHGSGDPSGIADTGSDPLRLRYPPKN